MKIFMGRPSAYGDIVSYLPFLTYLEKRFPGSYKIYNLSAKCHQMTQMLLNHPLIDKIWINKEHDKLNAEDQSLARTCDRVYEPNPPVQNPYWYNEVLLCEQQFTMSYDYNEGRFLNRDDYNLLTEEEKKPRLSPWWHVGQNKKAIALWGFAGYSLQDPTTASRSPSVKSWGWIMELLKSMGYMVLQFGHPQMPMLRGASFQANLGFFESVQKSLECDFAIGTDSGSMHILGAYGMKGICITTNWRENHIKNFDALVPVSWANNLKNFFCEGTIDNIDQEKFKQAILEISK